MAKKLAINRVTDVDIRLLDIFKTVVACGGFTAAEFELNIGRSTISKHISDLETRFGLKLCHRGPAGFSVTSDGEHVLGAAENLFIAIDAFQEELDQAHSDLTGKLKIACLDHSATNSAAKVADAIRMFRDAAPGVTLDVSMEPPNVIEEGVINGKFNIGIVPLHRTSPMLSYFDLYTEDMRLYCGRHHQLFAAEDNVLQPTELSDYSYVGLSFNSPNMDVHKKLKLRKSAFVQNEEALALLILSGRYLGFLPTHTAEPFVRKNLMREVKNDVANYTSTMSAIVRKSASSGRRLSAFLDCLIKAHPKESDGVSTA
ncbi:LysR family transcriptional regulator [Aliiroseovarius sp. M344]|uniref:LysR family transcriptional regulator n=1 Tax=Aliiroseovarius sp. M344 TaxID=2867010 RepID=UPI0021AD8439|nr:LysR family transcriptional regulator [Aliiroseovarius sp. M344]UWQ12913.1 LysR family transcriptional regulator [Aliiroseovarius sp. M344]